MTEEQNAPVEKVFQAGDTVVIKRLGCEATVLDCRGPVDRPRLFVAYVDGNGSNRRKWVDCEAVRQVAEESGGAEAADETETTEADADTADDTEKTDESEAADETVTDDDDERSDHN